MLEGGGWVLGVLFIRWSDFGVIVIDFGVTYGVITIVHLNRTVVKGSHFGVESS